jgi:maltose/maltodextrin transport system substrate-binding protein/arabinogalactan oligomer/maltooligosaccharide transport system substrate-binding protein
MIKSIFICHPSPKENCMHNKLRLFAILLLAATLVLAACGPGQATQPAEPAAPAEAETETEAEEAAEEPAASEEVTETEEMTETEEAAPSEEVTETEAAAEAAPAEGSATLTIWADEVRAPVLETLTAPFSEQYGVQVNVVQKGYDSLRNDFKVAAPTGEGPDILLGAHDWLGELIASGLLAEVSLGDKADLFAPNAVEAFTYTDGKLYGMPQATENVVLYYNTELVPEPPATFDEVKTLSAELQEAGNQYGFLIQTSDPYHFYGIQTAFDGYVFGQTDTGAWNPEDVGLDSEGTIAAFEWLDSMYEDGLLDPGSNIDGGLLLSAFQNGDAAMVISGPWALSGFRTAEVPYAIAPIPAGVAPGRPFLGVQGFMINAFSQNQLLAQTFLQQFVATDETMQAFYDRDPRPPAYLPLAETIEDVDIAAIVEAGAVADPMPNIPEMNSVWAAWGDAMTLISNQTQEPPEALTNAQAQVVDAIGQ